MKSRLPRLLILLIIMPLPGQSLRVGCQQTNAPLAPLMETLLKEEGYTVEMLILPLERSLLMLKAGEIDMDFFRAEAVIATDPELRRIDVPLIETTFRAYTKNPDITIRSREDLGKNPFAYARGTMILDRLTEGLEPMLALDNDRLFQMILRNRVEVIIINDQAREYLSRHYPDLILYPQEPPLIRLRAYAVVHRSREDLAAALEEVFRRWVREGRWERGMNRIISAGPGVP